MLQPSINPIDTSPICVLQTNSYPQSLSSCSSPTMTFNIITKLMQNLSLNKQVIVLESTIISITGLLHCQFLFNLLIFNHYLAILVPFNSLKKLGFAALRFWRIFLRVSIANIWRHCTAFLANMEEDWAEYAPTLEYKHFFTIDFLSQRERGLLEQGWLETWKCHFVPITSFLCKHWCDLSFLR